MVKRAVSAGIAGGILLDLYLWLTTALPAHQSMLPVWQFIASTVFGNVAFTSASYAAAGLAIHFLVSIGWAGGYAYFVQTQPATNRRWILAGAAYGLVVYVLMQLILLGGGHFTPPATPNALVIPVIGHIVFFGIPVAYVVRALTPEVSKA
ncbi:MAG TPA: hypothetical protein VGG89_10240 [Candidatus Baltobacteraceae bacterium]|jgi:uncharacterized membrane protein YagU involved in acid resistance